MISVVPSVREVRDSMENLDRQQIGQPEEPEASQLPDLSLSNKAESDASADRRLRGWAWIGLLAIIIVNVLGSLYWLRENIVLVGHDASAYLTTSLEYAEFLTKLTPQSLFTAFTYPPYRTPAIFIAAQPFLRFLGPDMDSAQLLNVTLLAAVIWLTYLLGVHLSNRRAALFAALLVGLFPMVAAMARLYYTEMFLTAMVTLNLVALYHGRAFSRRNWSLVWGMSLGIGLLVKWTMPIYVALPLIWVLWQDGIFAAFAQSVRNPRTWGRFDWRRAAAGLSVGIVVSTLWFWPNRELAQLYPLGNLLFICWALLVAGMVYLLLKPSSPSSNLWAGLFFAATIASLWYLPHSNFAARLLYEDQTRGQQTASPLRLQNYLRYFPYIYQDHFGALAFWLIVPVAMLPWLKSFWGRVVRGRQSLNGEAVLLWLSILSSLLVLSMFSQRNPRNLVPLLPAVAVLFTLGLFAYPRKVARGIGVIWISVLVIQWSLFTFGGSNGFFQRSRSLWASSDYVVRPNADSTNAGYWIGPTVLERVTASSDELQGLGMLVNSHEIHRGIFGYLIASEGFNVQTKSLTEADSEGWYDLLSTKWLLLKDGDNHNVEAPGQALLSRIADGDPLFEALYTEVERYSLPNGETAYLYQRTQGPAWPHAAPERLETTLSVAGAIDTAWSDAAHLVYASPDQAVWVGIHDPVAERFLIFDEADGSDVEQIKDLYGVILLVRAGDQRELRNWLEENAYRAGNVGSEDVSVTIYGRPEDPLDEISLEASWSDAELSRLKYDSAVRPGRVIPIRTTATVTPELDRKISMRLVSADGDVIASRDRPFLAADRYGLFVPPPTARGQYDLVAIVYDPTTMENILDGNGDIGTVLTTVAVE
jgi:4-amino-4-deoxy-L-arabinose transferase-like glycosyltransferase